MASSRSSRITIPEIVGFYSTDHYNNYTENLSELKYIRYVFSSEMPFELNGVVMRVPYYCDAIFINLLKFLKDNEGILMAELDTMPFVCNKMTLIKLCQTGCMQITACLYRNVIYLKSRNITEGYSKQTSSKVPRNVRPVSPKMSRDSRIFGRPQIPPTVIANQRDTNTQERTVATPSPPVAAKPLAPIMTESCQTSSSIREHRSLLDAVDLMASMTLHSETSSEQENRGPQVPKGLPEFGGYRPTFLEYRGTMVNKGPKIVHTQIQSVSAAEREMRWRLKLKQFLQSDISLRKFDTTKPSFSSQEFHCVFKYALNKHKIFYSGGVDGIIMNEKGPLIESNFYKEEIVQELNELELATLNAVLMTKEPTIKMRKNTSQILWLNAHFNRAENIITGKVDYNGFLQRLTNESIDDIIELGKGYWTPEDCLKQGNSFLSFIKDTIKNSMTERHMNGYQMKKYFKQLNDTCVEISEENAQDFPEIWFD